MASRIIKVDVSLTILLVS